MATDTPIWDNNGEWVELTDDQAQRLLAEGKIYLCPGDTRELPACHPEDVYHVHEGWSLREIKAQLAWGNDSIQFSRLNDEWAPPLLRGAIVMPPGTPKSLAHLIGRKARCYCGKERDSIEAKEHEAFFEYRGPGMNNPPCSVGTCFYVESVHQEINPHTGRPGVTDHAFVAREYEFDSFYCGCRGWD